MSNQERLAWSLVISTYKRAHILPRCLRLAAEQTRPPAQVVVIDASPDWADTRELVAQEFASKYPSIALIYAKANVASLTAQRNQGIDLATGEVVFLIDDDSLMYPDCAEEVMKVYELDKANAIQGVSAIGVPAPPDAGPESAPARGGVAAVRPKQTPLRRLFKTLLATKQTYFLPYDADYPARPIPEHLSHAVKRIRVMAGYSMTFRTPVVKQERFSELLSRYAAGEDQDLSYRVSRHGALVNAAKAKLCHLEISGGRLSPFHVAILAALNPAVLQQFHSPDRALVNRRWRGILGRRVVIYLLKDLADGELKFSRTRGILFALGQLREVYKRTPGELETWYPQFQRDLLST
jgi:GT2 family glycosyltransferase